MKHLLEYSQWIQINEGKVLTPSYYEKGLAIMNGLIDRGFTVNQAAGLVGNMFQESDLNPSSLASNGAFGLLQWLSARKKAMLKYTNNNATRDKQLDFIKQETTGAITYPDGHSDKYEKGRWEAASSAIRNGITKNGIKVSDTPDGWATAIDEYYVRSGGSALGVRKTAATTIADEYNKVLAATNFPASQVEPEQVEPEEVEPAFEPIGRLPLKPIDPL